MVYYKIPLTGGFDYPVGCILICSYSYGGYQYCQFERVTEVGADWVPITESEFNVRCPDFPEPALPPVQEVIATAAEVVDGALVLTLPRAVDTGTLVKFSAPCDCESVTGGIVIDGTTYAIVDAAGVEIVEIGSTWAAGALIAVLIDTENNRAFIQNPSLAEIAKTANAALPKSGGTMTGSLTMDGGDIILKEGINYGEELPAPGIKGRIFFKVVS